MVVDVAIEEEEEDRRDHRGGGHALVGRVGRVVLLAMGTPATCESTDPSRTPFIALPSLAPPETEEV